MVFESIKASIELSNHPGKKKGYIFTPTYKLQESRAIEVLERGDWNVDIGATSKELFAGISKDLLGDMIDIGAGVASDFKKIEPYVGVHIQF